LRAFALGELSARETNDIGTHVDKCPECLAAYNRLPETAPETHRIRRAPAERGGAASKAASQRGRAADERPSAAAEGSYSFLLPAGEAGEIGRVGGYRVLRVLGQGGMGIVFHAEDIALGRSVALKVMKPDLSASNDPWKRFLREARALARIKHDHVVAVFQA